MRPSSREYINGNWTVGPDTRVDFRTDSLLEEGSSVDTNDRLKFRSSRQHKGVKEQYIGRGFLLNFVLVT